MRRAFSLRSKGNDDDDFLDDDEPLVDSELEPDKGPIPGRFHRVRDSKPEKPLSATDIKEGIEGPLRVSFEMLGEAWKSVDEVCGSAFLSIAPTLAKRIAVIAKNDPETQEFLRKMLMQGWLGVGIALIPVGKAVTEHHVVPAIQRRREGRFYEEIPPEPPPTSGNSDSGVGRISG